MSYEKVIKNINKDDYKQIFIPKKNGVRTINFLPPTSKLYVLQQKLNRAFLNKQSIPLPAKGFKKGESYMSYLIPHIGSNYYLRVDILNFFPSITEDMISSELSNFLTFNTNDDTEKIIDLISSITTLDGILPQGACTSTTISNIVMSRLDQRILKYCQVLNVTYTRYADDMFFSSPTFDFAEKTWFLKKVKFILKTYDFRLNYSKIKKGNGEISLNGYIAGEDEVRLSRNRLSDIRHIVSFSAANYNLAKVDEAMFLEALNNLTLKHRDLKKYPFRTVFQFTQYMCGYRAFLISFLDEHYDTSFQKNIRKLIYKIEYNILLYD